MVDPISAAVAASAPLVQDVAENANPAVQTVSKHIAIFGYQMSTVTLAAMAVLLITIGILVMFWNIQRKQKLDFADMLTKDGKAVSLTKVLQLIGGITATWIMIKLTLTGGLTEALFGLYLTYVGAIEGYSKFVAAKYGYAEKSIREAKDDATKDGDK